MKIIYANTYYDPEESSGGNAHIFQFIKNAHKQGHEVWSWPQVKHPDCIKLPTSRLAKLRVMRQCDAVIYRIEDSVPQHINLMSFKYRRLLKSPKFIWEFNTVPEYGLLHGKSQKDVDSTIRSLSELAHLVDLAICVSDELAGYVRKIIGVKNVIVAPNGSDIDHFRPNCPAVPRASYFAATLNLIWMGSARLKWVDFELLHQAANLLWESEHRDKIMVHVVGQGMPPMRQMPPNIQYHAAELYENLPGWLSAMDVGLVSYKPGPADFSSPLKLFDYLASGLAVITTEQPQAAAVLAELDQHTSILKQGDAMGLVNLLEMFLDEPDLLQKYKMASRKIAIDKYNWSNTVSIVFDAIKQI